MSVSFFEKLKNVFMSRSPSSQDTSAKAFARTQSRSSDSTGKTSGGIQKGSFIKFGKYPQGANGEIAPIEWLVLDVQGNEILLLSRYGLDYRMYRSKWVNKITWAGSDLRRWLNNDFLKAAFSEDEQQKIKVSDLNNNDGGMNTSDLVFCLSIEEIVRYYGNDGEVYTSCLFGGDGYFGKNGEEMSKPSGERKCLPTDYACNQGVTVDNNGCCYWWVRSPGVFPYSAACVAPNGAFSLNAGVGPSNNVVRPALRIIR